jgi:alanine racemase
MSIRIQNIVPIIKAKAYGNTAEAVIDTVSIDSRSLQNSEHTFILHWLVLIMMRTILKIDSDGVQNFVVLRIQKDAQIRLIFIVENTLAASTALCRLLS